MNNQLKRRWKMILLIESMVFIIISIAFAIYITHIYEQYQYNWINHMMQTAKEVIPEEKWKQIEEKLVQSFIKEGEQKQSLPILQNYGITAENINENASLHTYIYQIWAIEVALILCFILGNIGIYVHFQKRQNKDLEQLDKYCKEILKGNYTISLQDENEGNFSILKNDIYDMTVMLKQTNEFLKKKNEDTENLIADISHQLKTPLTSLNMIHDVLEMQNISEEKRRELLQEMQKELDKIAWLIKTLLQIAKLDSRTIVLQKQQESTTQMLEELQQNFAPLCMQYHAEITITIEQKQIVCDKKWTLEAISNIVKNAIEHKSTKINIQAIENPFYTMITVQDNGEGISKEDMPHIFERFYKAKNSKTNSLGLGLAFAKSIIENQEGRIEVKSSKEGSIFFIKLPK